jgi:hypothetical protein
MDFDLGYGSSADEWPVLSICTDGGLVTHSPGITPLGVDSVWIPLYESNQRSNSHNKSP